MSRQRLSGGTSAGAGHVPLSSCVCGLAVVSVGSILIVGSLHPALTIAMCFALPGGLVLAHQRLRARRTRSPAVFAFACASIGLGYVCLATVSAVLRVVLLWEQLTLNLSLVLTCLLIRRTRATATQASSLAMLPDDALEAATSTPAPDVCIFCARSMPQLDHHSWWLNCCIGRANRLLYLLTLTFCIATGCYGVQLTATSICTPAIYLDWFLFPADCRFLYHDSMNALAACACVFVLVCVAMLTCELFLQTVLITAGVTWQELARGSSSTADAVLGLLSRLVRRKGACATAWLELCCLRR